MVPACQVGGREGHEVPPALLGVARRNDREGWGARRVWRLAGS